MTRGDVVDVGERHPTGRDARQAAADRVANGSVDPRSLPRPRPVDRGWVDDHDLDPLGCLGEHQLLGALLGALVRGALRVVGNRVLAHRPPGVRVEDIEGRGVDCSPDAGVPCRRDHVARPLGVHALEDARVREPLLEQAHAVEDALSAVGRLAD